MNNNTKCRKPHGPKKFLHIASEQVNWYYHFRKVWQYLLRLNIHYFIPSHILG